MPLERIVLIVLLTLPFWLPVLALIISVIAAPMLSSNISQGKDTVFSEPT